MYDPDATAHTFEAPETGTRHVLASNPEQSTLHGPPTQHHAVAHCGFSLTLRHGDLEAQRHVTNDEDLCSLCALSLYPFIEDPDDKVQDAYDAAIERLTG